MGITNCFLIDLRPATQAETLSGTVNVAINPWVETVHAPRMNLLLLFCYVNIVTNCPPISIFLPTERQLSSEWWLMKKLTTGPSADNFWGHAQSSILLFFNIYFMCMGGFACIYVPEKAERSLELGAGN